MNSEARLGGVRVLVLEDDDEARELTRILLTQAGAKVRTVPSVAELWKCFDDFCPHVVVSDICMPGVSGLDMVRTLRERRAVDGGFTGVVAVTALAFPTARAEGLKQGFDRYLTKPIDPVALIDIVAELADPAA